MIDKLWMYAHGVKRDFPFTLDEVFNYNIRFQILCDTMDQRDYLWSLQLMLGREVDIRTWAEWKRRGCTVPFGWDESEKMMTIPDWDIDERTLTHREQLLPIYFTTSVVKHDS